MGQIKAALFDFDGVLADTEPLYDRFWDDAGDRYHSGIPHFAAVIKGTTLPNILKKYFSGRTEEERLKLQAESEDFESRMPFPEIPGALGFVRMLKGNGVRTGLVTSSGDRKMKRAFREMGLDGLFDTFVSESRITRGKPDPMCYLLAAGDLGRRPEDCVVFEDSSAGISAATNAGMRVVGLCTTLPASALEGKVYKIIPDFRGLAFADYLSWQE